MERKKALALASTATLLVGSTMVSVASVSGASFLGFGAAHATVATATTSDANAAPGVVRKTRNIYDRYVLDLGGDPAATASPRVPRSASVAAAAPADFSIPVAPGPGAPNDATTPTTTRPSAPRTKTASPTPSRPKPPTSTPSTHSTEPDDPAPGTVPPTTAAPHSTTTIPTTTTTWPRGVPRDWPKDKPIPPMPPNCRQPQLEDNGVWNCDH